jgi:hypothetical protein
VERRGDGMTSMTADQHKRSVACYRSDTLENILRDIERKARKDRWDKDRITAIRAELKQRRKALEA